MNHMDEALVRLYSHPLVKPGMSMDQVRRLIIFRDELLDRPGAAPLTAMEILKKAYQKLHVAGSARYTISWGQDSSFWPGMHWPDYEVANYQFERPRWTHVNDGSNHYYMINYWDYETWSQVSGHWSQMGPVPAHVTFHHSVSPHYVLLLILKDYDRVEVEVMGRSAGKLTFKAKFDEGLVPGGRFYTYSLAEVIVVLDEKSYEISEYSFEGPGLGNFYARDGQYGIELEVPEGIREISENLSSCRPETLGFLSWTITLEGRLPGSCGPDPKRNLRQHHFSLDQLTTVNSSLRMISENAAAFTDGSLVILRLLKGGDMLASNSLFESPGVLSLGNVQLPAGDYTIELEAFDPGMRLEYELEIDSPLWPKATVLVTYDANRNGRIEADEVRDVIRDWFIEPVGSLVSTDQVRELIYLYFKGIDELAGDGEMR